MLDAAAVTALRTGAAAVLAAETLGRDGGTAAVDRRRRERARGGADVRRARADGRALGRRRERAREAAADELGAEVAGRARRRSPPTSS